jgi:YVTN family beta-propeller protein
MGVAGRDGGADLGITKTTSGACNRLRLVSPNPERRTLVVRSHRDRKPRLLRYNTISRPASRLVRHIIVVACTLLLVRCSGPPAFAFEAGPEVLVLSPDGSRLYVANSVVNTISVIDTAALRVAGTVALDGEDLLYGMAISPDGSRVYVSRSDHDTLDVIDTSTLQVVGNVQVGHIPAGIAVAPNTRQVYVANEDGTISVVDPGSAPVTSAGPHVSTTIRLADSPRAMAVSPDGKQVYAAGSTLTLIDTTSNEVAGTVDVGGYANASSVAVSADGTRVYVPFGDPDGTSYVVWIVEPAARRAVDRIEVPTGQRGAIPGGIALSPDGWRAYVTVSGREQMTVIDTVAGTVAANVKVAPDPGDIAVSPDGRRVYVIHQPSWSVDVINAGTLLPEGTVKLGPPSTGTN